MRLVNQLTIVTVTKNDLTGILRTVESVFLQSKMPLEFFIWDGGSDASIFNAMKDSIRKATIHSGGIDCGVYDAMNRCVQVSEGDWILFLNSGDILANPNILGDLDRMLPSQQDFGVIYGDSISQFSSGENWHRPAQQLDRLWYGMPFSHQSSIVRKDLLLQFPFRLGRFNSDFEFFHGLWRRGVGFYNCGMILSQIDAGGVSDRYRCRIISENMESVKRLSGLTFPHRLRFYFLFLREFQKLVMKAVLPVSACRVLQKLSHRLNS